MDPSCKRPSVRPASCRPGRRLPRAWSRGQCHVEHHCTRRPIYRHADSESCVDRVRFQPTDRHASVVESCGCHGSNKYRRASGEHDPFGRYSDTLEDDASVGAGIESFSIFVSDNGGPFTAFERDTDEKAGVFHGEVGHTYTFYSRARDGVGNEEKVAKNVAEATTTISGTVQYFAEGATGTSLRRGFRIAEPRRDRLRRHSCAVETDSRAEPSRHTVTLPAPRLAATVDVELPSPA